MGNTMGEYMRYITRKCGTLWGEPDRADTMSLMSGWVVYIFKIRIFNVQCKLTRWIDSSLSNFMPMDPLNSTDSSPCTLHLSSLACLTWIPSDLIYIPFNLHTMVSALLLWVHCVEGGARQMEQWVFPREKRWSNLNNTFGVMVYSGISLLRTPWD